MNTFQFDWPTTADGLKKLETPPAIVLEIGFNLGETPTSIPDKIKSAKARTAIARLVEGYKTPADFFIQKLSEGVGTIAAAFYPKPVIVRLSDFKTNEYASLLGGEAFEPKEENPML